MFSLSLISLLALNACADKADDSGDTAFVDDTGAVDGTPDVSPSKENQIDADKGDVTTFNISSLDDNQAYRATLVIGSNLTLEGTDAVFVDEDDNGAADAGASTTVATITSVNGEPYSGSKTVPGGEDDPSDPSGIFPENGEISIDVTAVGAGAVWLVVYENSGASTFLEIGDDGIPTERYGVSASIRVEADKEPDLTPAYAQSFASGESTVYTISDLDTSQAYRVTLVAAENITISGVSGLFADLDASGTADAGASEEVGLITMVNGQAIAAAKTFPGGDDDPSAPTGIFAMADGTITVEVEAQGAGSIIPVAYANGGSSTFLEVDGSGAPTEAYGLGGLFIVE